MKAIKHVPFELIFWVFALASLAFTDPNHNHFSLCPLANAGIDWCPGCGLGHSVSSLLQGQISESISQHWFGVPATVILLCRIFTLSTHLINLNKLTTNQIYHEP